MIQFHLSKSLSLDLATHLREREGVEQRAMQWYGHRVFVRRRKCIIMMELQSRYCMIFCGLTKPDFKRFPELFEDRLWREVLAICQPDEAHEKKLAAIARTVAAEQIYQTGHHRSVQGHINNIAFFLDDTAWQAGRLPANPEEEFAFGLQMNQSPTGRKGRTGRKSYIYPVEIFRDSWLGMLEQAND